MTIVSHLSYNMIGHCKFCVTLVGGFLLFQDPLSSNQLLGILSTITGIALYTFLKLREQKKNSSEHKQTQRV